MLNFDNGKNSKDIPDMKKYSIGATLFLFASLCAQESNKPCFEKKENRVSAVYYHDNGEVSQTGYFNSEGKLDGVWTSYDTAGNKVSQGHYSNGVKTGQWLFWFDGTLKEVDFVNAKIANVNEWHKKLDVALNTNQ